MKPPRRQLFRSPRAAFTLIELLLVTAILGVVISAIGACLGGGIRAWEASRSFNTVESQAMVGLRIFRRDIMNAVPFYAVPFSGSPRSMSFLVRLPASSTVGPGLSRVRYSFDSGEQALVRATWPFPGDESPGSAREERVMAHVSWLSFTYAPGDGASPPGGSWESKTNYPGRVSVELDLELDGREMSFLETVVAARNDGLKAGEEE